MTIGSFLRYATGHPMGRAAPLRTAANVLSWQLRSRFATGVLRWPWIGGTTLLVRKGMTGATGNIYFGLHEFSEMGFLLHLLRPGDYFADVGANVGSYSVLAAGVSGAQVVAFEPDPNTFADLKANIDGNGLASKVDARQVAIGAEAGEIAFSVGLDTMNRVLSAQEADQADQVQTVPVVTLDSALADMPVIMMKVDVEGHEPSVMRGARQLLANRSLLAVEIETVEESVLAALHDAGFQQYHYDPLTRTLVRCSSGAQHNNLFIRDPGVVGERLQTAPKVMVHGQHI